MQAFKSLLIGMMIVGYSLFLLPSALYAQVTLDPHNPGARPDPSTLKEQNITDVRVVLKQDAETVNYVNSLTAAGIDVIGIVNWEYNDQAWIGGGSISSNYIDHFTNNVVTDAYNTFGQLKAYQIWNEPDGVAGTIGLTPQSYAALLAAANNKFDELNRNQPMISAGFVSGNLDYIQQIVNTLGGIFPADGIAYHPYIPDPSRSGSINEVINGIKALNNMTGRPVWITEIGWETADENAQAAWLASVFSLLQNPETRPILQTVMWYAYSDAQKPGFGLFKTDGSAKEAMRQFLEIMLGHPISDELLAQLINVMMAVPTVSPQPVVIQRYSCSVNGVIPSSDIFRPDPCENCSLNVPNPTQSCAQPPVVFQKQDYTCGDIYECNGFRADFDWTPLTFNVDTTETKVPFVGYKEILRNNSDPEITRSENENDYLNDYIEGTALYDEREFDLTKVEDLVDWEFETGVYRKLAPQEIQDKHRKDMIARGFEYKIKGVVYSDPSKKLGPSMVEINMQEWGLPQSRPYTGDFNQGRLPPKAPDLSECDNVVSELINCRERLMNQYYQYLDEWQKSQWGQLWAHIPLFSREDAPGKATLTIEHIPGTLDPSGSTPTVQVPLSIPHLSRLYESTKALHKLLTPTIEAQNANAHNTSNSTSAVSYLKPNNTPVLLAQAGVSDISPKIYLAQANVENPSDCNGIEIRLEPNGDSYGVKAWNTQPSGCGDFSDTAEATLVFYADGQEISRCNPSFFGGNYICRRDQGCSTSAGGYSLGDHMDCAGRVPTQAQVGNRTLSVSFSIRSGNISGDPSQGCVQAASCNCKEGDPNCWGQKSPPPDPCSVHSNINSVCEAKSPVSDSNPNDEVCCQIDAQVQVEKYIYPVSAETQNRLCNPECEEWGFTAPGIWGCVDHEDPKATATMSRQIEVSLQIPYLSEVWKMTAGPENSIFNLFKPNEFPDYPDDEGLSHIKYEIATGGSDSFITLAKQDTSGSSSVEGELYYPYLGGIQQTKKCISEQYFIPADLQGPINLCQFWGGEFFNAKSNKPEEECVSLPRDLPYQPASALTISREQLFEYGSTGVGNKLGGNASESFEANFDTVFDAAVAADWNPAWVMALWIEESAASSVNAWDLGCVYDRDGSLNPKRDLDDQLQCLFAKPYADPNDYEAFMLKYSGNAGNNGLFCNENSGFPLKVDRYYQMLTEGIPYNDAVAGE